MQDELKSSVEKLGMVVKALRLTGMSAMTQAALVTGMFIIVVGRVVFIFELLGTIVER